MIRKDLKGRKVNGKRSQLITFVVRASRYDYVGLLLGRKTELLECRFHKMDVLMNHQLQITSTVCGGAKEMIRKKNFEKLE